MDSVEQHRADTAIWVMLFGLAAVVCLLLFRQAFHEPADPFERDCAASHGRVEKSIVGSGRYCFSFDGRPIDIDRK